MQKNFFYKVLSFVLTIAMVFSCSNIFLGITANAAGNTAGGETTEPHWWQKLNGARMYFFNDPGMAGEDIQNTYNDIKDEIPNLYDKGYRIISLYGLYESEPGDYGDNNTYCGLAPIDYYSQESAAGTMQEFEAMVAEADEYGMKIMAWINLGYSYPKHTYWIQAQNDKKNGVDSPEARSFFWSQTDEDGNGNDDWGWVESEIATGWYYKNSWGYPAFNWGSSDWQQEAKDILEFWHEKGIDGWILDAGKHYESNNDATKEILKEYVGDVCADAGVLLVSEGGHMTTQEAMDRNFYGVYDNLAPNSTSHDSWNMGTQCISAARADRLKYDNKGTSYMTIEQYLAQKNDVMRANGGVTFSYDPESGITDQRRPLEIALMTSVGVLYEAYFSRDWDVEGELGGDSREYANAADMEAVFKAVNSTTALEPGGSRLNLSNDKATTVYSMAKTSMDGKKKALCMFNFSSSPQTVTVDLAGSGISTDQTPYDLIADANYATAITSDSYTVTLGARSFLMLSVKSESKDITAFSIGNSNGIINDTDITVTLPYGTDVESLEPEITHTGVSVDPASGVAQDFSNPVQYKVTAEDGTTKIYTVTVELSAANLASITQPNEIVVPVATAGVTAPQLPSQVEGILEGGGTAKLDVDWDNESTPPFDGSTPGSYVFGGTVNLPADITNNNGVSLSVSITVRVLDHVPTAADIASGITTIPAPAKDSITLTLPSVPGFIITIKSVNPAGIIALDGTITPPDRDTDVTVILTVTNDNDPLDAADTIAITVKVPAKTSTINDNNNGGNNSNNNDSGSSRSSSGSRDSNRGETSAPTRYTSNNVNSNGSISQQAVVSEANTALGAPGNSAKIRSVNAGSISPSALKALRNAAEKAGKALVLHADTLGSDNRSVQGRLYVEPDKLTDLKDDLKLGIYTEASKTASTKSLFEKHFDNKVAVVSCEQQGSFGARTKIAAKVDLSGIDTSNLVFYSYDKETNKYTQITDAQYYIDKNGYLHFYTELAGDIIISSKELVKKI